MSLIGALHPSLLLIDDFEVGFHPSLIKIFLEWLKEKDWQTVISTQSIDLLDKLTEVKPSNTTILQLHKSQDDILSYKSLDLEQLEDLLDANTDPRLLVN
jgi:predicted ATPase